MVSRRELERRARVNLKGLFTFSFLETFLSRHSTSNVYENVQNFGGRSSILSSEVKRSECSCVVYVYQFKKFTEEDYSILQPN